jgi:glycerophosphoryl diester phosphodiesterase
MNILLDAAARPVIGHRGNRAHAPENTIESFAQAVAAGADAIELDVHLSADGIPVVIHDPTLERTTDGTGEIARMNFAEIRRADAGAKFTKDGKTFPYRGAGHRVPRFEEVVEAFPSTPLLIEIKAPLASVQVRRIIEERMAADRVVVDSFRPEALTIFEESDIPVGASRDGIARILRESLGGKPLGQPEFSAICTPLSYYGFPLPVKRFARVARRYDVRVHVWTVNDTRVARELWVAGVNGIVSDEPLRMIEARKGVV